MKAILVAALLICSAATVSADAFQAFSNIVNFKATIKDIVENPTSIDPSRLYLFDGTISAIHVLSSEADNFEAELEFINSEWVGTSDIKTYRIKLIVSKPSFAPLFPQRPGQHPGPGQLAPNNRALVLVQFISSTKDTDGSLIMSFQVHELRLLR